MVCHCYCIYCMASDVAQQFQVPKMEVLNLIRRFFLGVSFPLHTVYIGEYLHFKYQVPEMFGDDVERRCSSFCFAIAWWLEKKRFQRDLAMELSDAEKP